MKKNLIILSFSILVVLVSACSATKKTTASGDAKAAREIKTSNYTTAELEEGKMLWETKCDRCHKLYLPETRTKEKWEGILPRMSKRSKLDEAEAGKVRGYIMAHAKA
jgi:cytochrome c5